VVAAWAAWAVADEAASGYCAALTDSTEEGPIIYVYDGKY
jgi:hypothetical protein